MTNQMDLSRRDFHRITGAAFVGVAAGTAVETVAQNAQAHATYYVSNDGSDAANGRSPDTAWSTLNHVSAADLKPADSVLFRRGDTWRGQLHVKSGAEGKPITYGAYGEGPKPIFLGSAVLSRAEQWRHEGDNIWSTTKKDRHLLPKDVGNMILNGGESCGVKVWRQADLDAQGKFWYDRDRQAVKLSLAQNPATVYDSIECALGRHIISQWRTAYVTYENLDLRYGGSHGIAGGDVHHIAVRGCDFSFIGGAQHGDRVRFGNGVEFWGGAHDCLVENCRLWEIYDTALTNQNSGATVQQYNITYRNNVIWNCEYSFEYKNGPETSRTWNIVFENNTCAFAGHGWGGSQRPNPGGAQLLFMYGIQGSPAQSKDIIIRNNIFFEARGHAFWAPAWPKEGTDAALRMDHNCWYQPEGFMVFLQAEVFTMSQFSRYQTERDTEPNSIAADPRFVDRARGDFRLRADSPCIDAGVVTDRKADFDGTPVPQGSAPDIGACEYHK